MRSVFAALSGITGFIGYLPYIHGMVRRGKRPKKATWFIWAVLDTIVLAAMIAQGTLNPQIIAVVTGCWTVSAFTLFYGDQGLDRLDHFCLAGAAIGIALWAILGNPTAGLCASLSVTCLAAFPTFRSAWKAPEKEDVTSWVFYTLGSAFASLAIPAWTLDAAAQPLAFLWIASTALVILLIRSRRRPVDSHPFP